MSQLSSGCFLVPRSHEGHDDRGIRTGGAGAGGERRGGKG